MYKTSNGGTQWAPSSSGIWASDVSSVIVDPSNPAGLYAATYGNGAFKTALAINPLTPTTVYAGTSTGVFRTTNGGNHWSPIGSGLSAGYVQVLLVHPVTPTIVYAAINPLDGVFRSADGGSTWTPANSGLPEVVFSLLVDPARPNVVYAGAGGRVYRSTDTGQSWSPLNFGSAPSESIPSVAVGLGTLPTIFGGTYSAGVLLGEPARLDLPLVLR